MDLHGLFLHCFSFTWSIQGKNHLIFVISKYYLNDPIWVVFLLSFSLLVFAQKRSNHILTILMALSFYFQVILSCLVFHDIFTDGLIKYWIGTAHPMVRLPVFFMGVCAGVLCIRIQQGDLDAFHSKFEFYKIFQLVPMKT